MPIFCKLVFFCCLLLVATTNTANAAPPPEKTDSSFGKSTYTFKRVGDLALRADVYRSDGSKHQPTIVWLHGGALIMGSRSGVPKQLLELAESHGFVVVSLDYRLAPETQLDGIIEDLRDGLAWVQETGPTKFHADTSRLVVAGASAGGYLALMSGVVAKPTAIVSYWGFGDVDGEWTTSPNAAYGKGKLIDKDTAWSGVGKQPLVAANKTNGRGRATFFLYLKQTGGWLKAVSGFDPQQDRDRITPFCPVRNVTAEHPPTLFLHGTADRDVPVEQSQAMARELERHDVPHELITVEGGGHSLWGGDRKEIDRAFKRSMEFIREQLTK